MSGPVWPDSYIDWAKDLKPLLGQIVEQSLNNLLSPNPLPDQDMRDLIDQVVVEALNEAYGHLRDPGYFLDKDQFRRWLNTVAFREALRLLLRNGRVEFCLHELPHDQCRLLGMVYLDRLPYGDVQSILHLSLDDVRQQSQNALNALLQLIRQE